MWLRFGARLGSLIVLTAMLVHEARGRFTRSTFVIWRKAVGLRARVVSGGGLSRVCPGEESGLVTQ